MIRVSKLVIIAGVAAALATPAFAQSFDPEAGTGNVLPSSFAATAVPNNNVAVVPAGHSKIAARQSGLHAFAMVPSSTGGSPAGANSNDPALTGAGSVGYNQMLLQD
jgi:hypothetical protein